MSGVHSNKVCCWGVPISDPWHCFDQESSLKLWRIHARKKFVYGLKCLQKDEFPPTIDAEENDLESPVYSCKFGVSDATRSMLCLAYENGKIAVQQMVGPDEGKFIIDKVAFGNAIFDISWIPDRTEIITAVADASVCLWSLGTDDLKPMSLFKGHTKAVKSVNVNTWDHNVFASGGKDCNAIIWDTRCHPSKKANMVAGAHSSQRILNSPGVHKSTSSMMQNSIISLLFNQQHQLLTAGASDGVVKLWDLRRTYCHRKREPQSLQVFDYSGVSSFRGYSSMCLSPRADRFYVSCLDGKIYSYHLANPTPKPICEYFGHKTNTYYAKSCLSPCGSFLLSGSSDDRAYIWLTASPGAPLASLSGHFDEVTSVAWSEENLGMVVTCSDDLKHRVFRYQPTRDDIKGTQKDERGIAIPYENRLDRKVDCGDPSQPQTSRVSFTATPLSKSSHREGHAEEAGHVKSLPRVQTPSTPCQSQIRRKNEHTTPHTSGKETLLSWLSCSKTPRTTPPLATPSSESRKASKRKLADFMETNQENLRNEEKKPAISPSKNVLTNKQNQNSAASNCVAKMLTYEERSESVGLVPHANDGFKLIDADKNDIVESASSFGFKPSRTTPQPPTKPSFDNVTPIKVNSPSSLHTNHRLSPINVSLLSSPTANLPNYVVDGRSPHDRRESPLRPKKETDWLTSLSQRKRNKFALGMKRLSEEKTTTKKKGLPNKKSSTKMKLK